jgi:hypothetical protein
VRGRLDDNPSVAWLHLVLVAFPALLVLAWGPGNHLELGERVWRARRSALPARAARLIGRHRLPFFYGTLAADLIHFKKFGGPDNHCHRWSMVEGMRERVATGAEEAFVMGYAVHLAADTVAHNHFVPYHLARFQRGEGLGHVYWELNADRFVDVSRWEIAREIAAHQDLAAFDELVLGCVPRRLLPMRANRLLFRQAILVGQRRRWRHGLARLHPVDKLRLDPAFLERFRRAALQRALAVLGPGGVAHLECFDACGTDAQRSALATARAERGDLTRQITWLSRGRAARSAAAEARALEFLDGLDDLDRA